jgi:hypothetical protein
VIQVTLNEAGCLASWEALRYFDTDGSPIRIGPEIWRTKGQQPKRYQTLYGEVELERHVYQRSGGGATYCPLEREARIVITSTPRFAKQVSSKFAQGTARDVQRDLAENHARPAAVSYLQRLCRSGMRWKEKGAAIVLSLRALMLTPDRWRQFWDKLDQFGFPVAAS